MVSKMLVFCIGTLYYTSLFSNVPKFRYPTPLLFLLRNHIEQAWTTEIKRRPKTQIDIKNEQKEFSTSFLFYLKDNLCGLTL